MCMCFWVCVQCLCAFDICGAFVLQYVLAFVGCSVVAVCVVCLFASVCVGVWFVRMCD